MKIGLFLALLVLLASTNVFGQKPSGRKSHLEKTKTIPDGIESEDGDHTGIKTDKVVTDGLGDGELSQTGFDHETEHLPKKTVTTIVREETVPGTTVVRDEKKTVTTVREETVPSVTFVREEKKPVTIVREETVPSTTIVREETVPSTTIVREETVPSTTVVREKVKHIETDGEH
jgi:hypothetical protein